MPILSPTSSTPSGAGTRPAGRAARLASVAPHLAILAVGFAILAGATWRAWPDALVDFGRELYVPWRLVEGDRLYSDIAWFNGPLSAAWNALVFRLGGVGATSLFVANGLLFALTLLLLRGLLARLVTPWVATAATLAAMALCGFGQLTGVGNYNFLAPYSHELPHGVLLGLAALAGLFRWLATGSWRALFAAGLASGAAFLTKPEPFLAVAVAGGVAIALGAPPGSPSRRRAAAIHGAGAAAPVALAWMFLSSWLGPVAALRAAAGAWPAILAGRGSTLPFYRQNLGIDAPLAHLGRMLVVAGGVVAFLLPVVALAFALRRRPAIGATGAAGAALLELAFVAPRFAWPDLARPWPLFLAVALLLGGVRALRERRPERVAACAFAAFALALLAKMLLHAQVAHYGFALAFPAAALVVAGLLDGLPRALERFAVPPTALRAALAVAVAGVVAIHLDVQAGADARKRLWIGDGADRIRVDGRGAAIAEALAWLDEHDRSPSGERPTLAVFPAGAMLNYLARRESPTPYLVYLPLEVELFGETAMLAALERRPPDHVLVVHLSTAEYGLPWFGRDYGRDLAAWIDRRYELVARFDDPPLVAGSTFGIAVLARRADPP